MNIDTPASLPIVIPIGRDYSLQIGLRLKTSQVYISLIDCTFKAQIRKSEKPSSDLVGTFTVLVAEQLHAEYLADVLSGAFVGTEAAWLVYKGYPELYDPLASLTGIIWLKLTDAETLAMPSVRGTAWWDLLITDAYGNDQTYCEGEVSFKQFPTVK